IAAGGSGVFAELRGAIDIGGGESFLNDLKFTRTGLGQGLTRLRVRVECRIYQLAVEIALFIRTSYGGAGDVCFRAYVITAERLACASSTGGDVVFENLEGSARAVLQGCALFD